MQGFRYKNHELYCEGVQLGRIGQKLGTPVYVYSQNQIRENFHHFDRAFKKIRHLTCYALKAQSNLGIARLLAREGAGCDIVSGGELQRAILAGFPAQKIVFAGVGKTEKEISAALKSNILMFNVESLSELELINRIAKGMGKKAPVALRVNPRINPRTHPHIATALRESKFGIDIGHALDFYKKAAKLKWIEIWGIHTHLGSQITALTPFREALEKIVWLFKKLQERGIDLKYIDLGGGLGIPYQEEKIPGPGQLARALLPLLRKLPVKFIFEPGRYIVGNAGVLLTRVLYLKKSGQRKIVVVDAGMNDLLRPALYNAYHRIVPAKKRSPEEKMVVDIVGPICEASDFFARQRRIPLLARGDLLAILDTGAYGFSMSSNYNSRPRPAEVLVDGDKYYLIRRRETFKDLIRGEQIPRTLK